MSLEIIKRFFANGLTIREPEAQPWEARFISALAREARRFRLETPARVFLEGLYPLGTLAASLLVACEPVAELLFPSQEYRRLVRFTQSRKNLERLMAELGDAKFTEILDSGGPGEYNEKRHLGAGAILKKAE